MGGRTIDTPRARTRRTTLAAALAAIAVALTACGSPYSTDTVREAFTALSGVEDAGVSSSPQPPLPDQHNGWVDVSPSISVDEYAEAVALTSDFPDLAWRVGTRGATTPQFTVYIDATEIPHPGPDQSRAAAEWALGAASLDGVARVQASLTDGLSGEPTARLDVDLADDGSETTERMVSLLGELDALTPELPGADLLITGADKALSIAPYSPVPLQALREIAEYAQVVGVSGSYQDGEGGMVVTIADDASVDAVQDLADGNADEWGAVTVLGPYDDFDIAPGDQAGPATAATAKTIRDLPGTFVTKVENGTAYVSLITLEEAVLIDEHMADDATYRDAELTWVFKEAGALASAHKPAGHPLVIDPLVQASQIDGVEEIFTTKPRPVDQDSAEDGPALRVEMRAVRSDVADFAQELRSRGLGALTDVEAQFSVLDAQGESLALVKATIGAQGDFIDILETRRDHGDDFVEAWNAAG